MDQEVDLLQYLPHNHPTHALVLRDVAQRVKNCKRTGARSGHALSRRPDQAAQVDASQDADFGAAVVRSTVPQKKMRLNGSHAY